MNNPQPATDAGSAHQPNRGIDGNGTPFTSTDQSATAALVTGNPPSGMFLVVDDLIVSVDTAMTVTFTEETTGTVVSKVYLPANGTLNLVTRAKRRLKAAGKGLKVQTSAAGNICVECLWHPELETGRVA